jgi:hypothetical protein
LGFEDLPEERVLFRLALLDLVPGFLEAMSEQAVDAALLAAAQDVKAANDVRRAVAQEREEARYGSASASARCTS